MMKLATIFVVIFLVGSAFGQVEKTKVPHYSGEVWYSFRDRTDESSDEGKASAPAHESEELPTPTCQQNETEQTCLIQGKAKHLPYLFDIRVKETKANGKVTVDVKLFSEDGKMIAGFPKHVEKKSVQIGGGVSVVIPVNKALEGRITKELLSSDSFLTYVSVVIRKSIEDK